MASWQYVVFFSMMQNIAFPAGQRVASGTRWRNESTNQRAHGRGAPVEEQFDWRPDQPGPGPEWPGNGATTIWGEVHGIKSVSEVYLSNFYRFWARSLPMREDVTYVKSALCGWYLDLMGWYLISSIGSTHGRQYHLQCSFVILVSTWQSRVAVK